MNTIKVSKTELLETLTKNKAKHIQEYKEAMDGYFAEAKKALRNLMKTCNKQEEFDFGELTHLDIPVSHENDYETVIQMLNWDTTDTIELSRDEFTKYVMDSWLWKDTFSATISNYSSAKLQRKK
jgi:hypothetical protein